MPTTTTEGLACTVADLATGDSLLSLGGVGFSQLHDPDARPVLVADVRPPLDETNPDEAIAEVVTSTGTLYARLSAPALVARDDTVTRRTVLLISRRQMLHASLLTLGVPVVRRTPVEAGRTVPAVTAAEWNAAALIVIDGYLAVSTLRAMWSRGDLAERQQIIMVGTDPDDSTVYQRQVVARARTAAVLPYDRAGLTDLFAAATGIGESANPWFGVLTPRPDSDSPSAGPDTFPSQG